MLAWLAQNWSLVLTDSALVLGGLAGLDKILEQVFPNAQILKSIGSGIASVLGVLPKPPSQ